MSNNKSDLVEYKPNIFVTLFKLAIVFMIACATFLFGLALGDVEQLDKKNCYRVGISSQFTYFTIVPDEKHVLYACAKGEKVEKK